MRICSNVLVPPYIVNGLRAAFEPFDVEAREVISNINRHASIIDNTAVTAEMEKADMFQKRKDANFKSRQGWGTYLN
jgi:hypothetical protein